MMLIELIMVILMIMMMMNTEVLEDYLKTIITNQ